MFSKSPNGTVSLEVKAGKLRIRLPRYLYNGKQKYISLGLDANEENKIKALEVIANIESDISNECFDCSRSKYRFHHLKLIEAPTDIEKPLSALSLWEKYVAFKSPEWSLTYKENMINATTAHLKRVDGIEILKPSDAVKIRDKLIKNISLDATRRVLLGLSAAFTWGKASGLVYGENFFSKLKADLNTKKSESEELDIEAFTKKEKDAILAAIEEETFSRYQGKHFQYYHYAKFMFFTGARTSEILGLKWEHIQEHWIIFQEAKVMADRGKATQKKGLKTQKSRKFPINSQLREVLDSIPKRSEYVFTKEDGTPIHPNTFRLSVWKQVLAGLGIKYRKPYQARHTFITLCLESGIDAKDVAKWVGSSPEIIYRHYAGHRRDLQVPIM
ncbi:MAG: tyrosine-type recombinase/integrase [Chroococcales cyanobacterium]